MQYIVLDMEWNQPWPGSYAAQRQLPVQIHGEVIQIGAVRMLEDQTVADEFQVLIRPKFYRRLNSRVSKLTGIRESRLKQEGLSFDDAINEFYNWCGDDCVFLTWGFDDIPTLEGNMILNGYDPVWIQNWYNAQMIYNAQTGSGSNQKALSTALEEMQIPPTRQAHDALGDAYHTALICTRLDLRKGVAEYQKALDSHVNGFHGAPPEGCISRSVFRGYADHSDAMSAMNELKSHCPQCGAAMPNGAWIAQEGRRYMTMAECPEHGRYLIRIRLQKESDGTMRVSRLIYEGASDAAQKFDELAARRRPARRRRRKSTQRKAEQ